ncbi:transcriptional regulator GcvA [Thalassospira alkalitolerans]|uniref:LysR family transcriptional regulator n=1 Tax=Thalassospira alkalitolerans TaxID=1293890 RepID=A0A1Y2LB77_9PROT|nr:transcriptional regulator GcvA [Thalassospira alkalitolerans]OSQ47977.1 LysR family transcriptional regulator [Thalassospira alkalitolerans]
MPLPPLATLRAFEAAARHLSFKRAASELAVTPTAISHQVRLLEDTLGVRLFDRKPRQVTLTPAGQELYPTLRDGFAGFSAVIDRVRARKSQRGLTVSVLASFAAKWLLPRLAGFQAAHPDIHMRLHTSAEAVDLKSGMADAAVRYGRGPFPGMVVQTLFADRFAPVCSPMLNIRHPGDLRNHALLHLEWLRPDDVTPTWSRWCKLAGVDGVDLAAGLSFSDDTHAIQAAIAGQGVVLASSEMVQSELESGVLVQPFGPVIEGHYYHLIHTGKSSNLAEIEAFGAWLASEITNTQSA